MSMLEFLEKYYQGRYKFECTVYRTNGFKDYTIDVNYYVNNNYNKLLQLVNSSDLIDHIDCKTIVSLPSVEKLPGMDYTLDYTLIRKSKE